MSGWLIILVAILYGYVALEQCLKGNVEMAIVYSGYAFSNIGLYMLAAR